MLAVPRVEVVVVNYNAGPILTECVSAVLGSTQPVHLTLVDNASTDGSLDAALAGAAGQQEITVLRNQMNQGFAAANNLAMRRSQADFWLVLNPDCLLQPDTLERLLPRMREDPKVGMLGCRILNPDGSEQAGGRRRLPDLASGVLRAFGAGRGVAGRQVDRNREPLPSEPIEVEAISGAFMLVRGQALAEVGLFDEGYFLHCEDLDWCRRFSDAGWRILFVPDVEVVHRKGACSEAQPVRVSFHKHAGMIRYYRKFLAGRHLWLLNWIVYAGVWLRFGLLTMRSALGGRGRGGD